MAKIVEGYRPTADFISPAGRAAATAKMAEWDTRSAARAKARAGTLDLTPGTADTLGMNHQQRQEQMDAGMLRPVAPGNLSPHNAAATAQGLQVFQGPGGGLRYGYENVNAAPLPQGNPNATIPPRGTHVNPPAPAGYAAAQKKPTQAPGTRSPATNRAMQRKAAADKKKAGGRKPVTYLEGKALEATRTKGIYRGGQVGGPLDAAGTAERVRKTREDQRRQKEIDAQLKAIDQDEAMPANRRSALKDELTGESEMIGRREAYWNAYDQHQKQQEAKAKTHVGFEPFVPTPFPLDPAEWGVESARGSTASREATQPPPALEPTSYDAGGPSYTPHTMPFSADQPRGEIPGIGMGVARQIDPGTGLPTYIEIEGNTSPGTVGVDEATGRDVIEFNGVWIYLDTGEPWVSTLVPGMVQ